MGECSTFEMGEGMNGFDDFDTKATAEEFYKDWTEDEADYYGAWREEQARMRTILNPNDSVTRPLQSNA